MSDFSNLAPHPNIPADRFCSEVSRQVGEELYGTATTVRVWLLLEYNAPWGRKAFEESTLPQNVKDRLSELLSGIPKSRLQFIKQQEPRHGITFFLGVADEFSPALYEFQLATYQDLLGLDLAPILAGDRAAREFMREEPLFLVCTNGKRDRCCARTGFPVYQAMTEHAGPSVWQSTHIGGHRFAATAVFLPHGICYGRITEREVKALVDSFCAGHIDLERYRGRSCHDSLVQAADYYLRTATDVADVFGYRFSQVRALGEELWAVEFSAADGYAHAVHVGRERSGVVRDESCGAEAPTELSRYQLIHV